MKLMIDTLRHRNKLILSVAGLSLLGSAACSAEGAKDYGPADSSITCITIEDGARFRTEPSVPGQNDTPNDLFTIKLADHTRYATAPAEFNIPTPEGVSQHTDNNGLWYGIPARNALRVILGQKDQKKISGDGDGIVWVNTQLAQAAPAEECTVQ